MLEEFLKTKSFTLLKSFLDKNALTIKFEKDSSDDYFDLENMLIHCGTVDKKDGEEIMFSILHEVGHFLSYCIDPELGTAEDMDTIFVEITSWIYGLDLAESLGIHLEKRKFFNYAQCSVRKYIKSLNI